MAGLAGWISARGGIAHRAALIAAGFSGSHVDRAARRGEVIRVRPGIYATWDAPPDVIRSARVGGRLAGESAARHWGLWRPPGSRLVVEVGRSANHLRSPDDARRPLGAADDVLVLWTSSARSLREVIGVSPLRDVLRQCFLTLPKAYAVAVLDSALRSHPIDVIDLAELQHSLPSAFDGVVGQAEPRAESGTESVMRVELQARGHELQIQVRVPFTDLDRLDILIGDRLVIECDSEAHHGGREQRLRDLRRDAYLAALGFIVLRFDYQQVMFERDSVLAAVDAYVHAGLHLSTRRS